MRISKSSEGQSAEGRAAVLLAGCGGSQRLLLGQAILPRRKSAGLEQSGDSVSQRRQGSELIQASIAIDANLQLDSLEGQVNVVVVIWACKGLLYTG